MITDEGREIKLKPVAQTLISGIEVRLRREFKDAKRSIDPPTYKITNVAGDVETHLLDEESIEDPSDPKQTEINRTAWVEYQLNLASFDQERNRRTSRIALYHGVDYDAAAYKQGDWAKVQSDLGVDVPDEGVDRVVHYISTELLKTPTDIFNSILQVVNLSMSGAVGEEAIEAAMRSFRNSLRASGTSSTPREALPQEEQVVAQPETP